ncbi:hypothetical protein BN946_scf184334.g3 [Trametes cinnabarina]|uniref:Polynucleotide adenylyltransferase n=1 Tax=Pycnoporus cinnabarinus TaxID=5643 RepID=A0A060SLN3_PYCCI|nr:hypothetical protein BN946_scf184334.g3 [Trametes cinnabarina]
MKLRRQKTLQNLAAVLQAKYGSGYEVEPFGSTCYGASCSSSDIDVSILDPERPFGFDPKDEKALPPIYSVRYADYELTDPKTGMSCDVNVNCRLGTYNTKLIRQYCLRLPPLAQYIRNIKLWVKSKDLNNPSTRGVEPSFSSYAITLMTIAYLQSLGFLPNLQTDRYPIFETHFWERSSSGARRTRVDVRFGARKLWKPAPGSLPPIERWFNFWAHEFDYAKEMPKQYRGDIVVLDPFQEKNVARRISARILGLFRESCEAAVRESDVVFKANRVSDKAAELLTEEFRKALKYEP